MKFYSLFLITRWKKNVCKNIPSGFWQPLKFGSPMWHHASSALGWTWLHCFKDTTTCL